MLARSAGELLLDEVYHKSGSTGIKMEEDVTLAVPCPKEDSGDLNAEHQQGTGLSKHGHLRAVNPILFPMKLNGVSWPMQSPLTQGQVYVGFVY